MQDEKIKLEKFVRKLVSIKSTSYNEMELAGYISGLLSERNIPHRLDDFSPKQGTNTANIYVELGKGTETLLLYAHTDVVDAPEKMFHPTISENKLFGRGTADMKTSLAGQIMVLLEDYEQLRHADKRIVFSFIADEETSASGIKRFAYWAKQQDYGNLYCVLMEPSDDFSKLNVGGRGYVFLNLEGSMHDVLDSLKSIKNSKDSILQKYPDNDDGFLGSTIEITKVSCQEIDDEKIVVNGKACHASRPYNGINAVELALEKYPACTYLLSSSTEGPNSLSSKAYVAFGNHYNISCKAHVDIRANLIASANDSLQTDVTSLIKGNVKVSVRDYGQAFLVKDRRLIDMCKKDMPFDSVEKIAVGGSDAPYLLQITPNVIPGFGPGMIDVSHTDDEYVKLDVMNKTPQVVRQIIKNFLEL